jgi:hypothetical protein
MVQLKYVRMSESAFLFFGGMSPVLGGLINKG